MKTILIVSNYAWTLYNFRLPLIRRLKEAGYRVELAAQFDGYERKLENEVDYLHNLYISRGGVNPITDLMTLLHLIFLIKRSRSNLSLFFTIKPVIYGCLAARILGVPSIPMITGLGTAFISGSWLNAVVKLLYKVSLASCSTIFFQNKDDRRIFLDNSLVNSDVCRLSPGSGIDTNRFRPDARSDEGNKGDGEFVFLLIARMIKDKGVVEFVDAARTVRTKFDNVQCRMLGPLGVQNRSAVSRHEIIQWTSAGIVTYLGSTDEVAPYIAAADCIVLPSYREGTSRVLLEAASMAKPIITTDVPGCREIVEHGINGFLCCARDADDLAEQMMAMVSLPKKKRHQMGHEGRRKVVNGFDEMVVVDLFMEAVRDATDGSVN